MLTPSIAYATLTSKLAPRLESQLLAVVASSHATSVAYCWAVLGLYDLSGGLSYAETGRINQIVREWRKRNGWSDVGDYKYQQRR